MREIKFRAWNKKAKIMFQDVGFDQTSHSGDTIIYLQYTGLKDKNGKEIYEGDIVSYQYPQQQLKHHKQRCTVIYEDRAAAFLLKASYFEPGVKYLGDIVHNDTRTYELCEVIGNIYENKDLLK